MSAKSGEIMTSSIKKK